MPTTTPESNTLLLVLSGPSGVGKDAVLSRLKQLDFPLHYTVTATTRPRRPGEQDGVDYFFLTQAEFLEMGQNRQFLESAQVYGHWYGVPRAPVQQALRQGRDVIIKADVQGAATIKSVAPDAILIFLVPPSFEDMEGRLRQRQTESSIDLELRLNTARQEMERLPLFDYRVINPFGRLDEAVEQIRAIIIAEKCRVAPRRVSL